MRAPGFAALGLAAYSVFLVATIPAAYVAAQVTSAMSARLELGDAQGTLWRGSVRARIAPSRGGKVVDRIEWRFVPARLAAGEIAFALRASAGDLTASAEAARGFSHWRLRDAKAEGDASALASFIPPIAPWQPAGKVSLTAPSLTFEGRDLYGTLDAEWRGAAVGLSEVRPLGSYRATWRAENGPGRIVVTTLQGPLRVSGEGTTTPGLRIAFSGEARGEGDAAKALEPLLDLMGPRRPDGARALQIRIE